MSKENDALVKGLVAHRGFHYANDDLKRPIENTVAAYEHAWAAGVRNSECDVTTTKDGEVVLSHDDTLKRLALRPEQASKPVKEMMFSKQLEFFPLKDGSRVPKLTEVLAASKRVGPDAKLIIEIKGKDLECARKVAQIALGEQGDHIAVVMSFALESIHEFAKLNLRRGKLLSMLLTVKRDSHDGSITLDLAKFTALEKLMKDNSIDGLYIEYDQTLLTDNRFSALCKRYPIGVWGVTRDGKSVAQQLMARGAKFVNTDFGDDFFHI
jgi:glycerophosphoryl diester phosphodiesterase